jgi:hypothetical protein
MRHGLSAEEADTRSVRAESKTTIDSLETERRSPRLRCVILAFLLLSTSSCLRAWDEGGPWLCGKDPSGNDTVCPEGYTCDDQICCKLGGTPACPTLPLPNGRCPEGEPKVYFQDLDGDGDGNEKLSKVFCRAPRVVEGQTKYVLSGRDCDDTRPDIFFGAPELCNGKDDNCDRVIDEGLPNLQNFYYDEDGDGVGDTAALVPACMAPPGYSALPGDCAPLDPSKFPGATEQCNNLDDDCDGTADTLETTFADSDNASTMRFPCTVQGASGICRPGTFRCDVQGGQVVRACRSLNTPAPTDLCDGLDNDCDGAVDEAPSCGGPVSLIGAPGVTYRAQRLTGTAQLNSSCQANLPGTASTVSGDGRTWSAVAGPSQYYHVWSAQAPAGTTWDLSKLNAQLRIAFTATASPYAGAGGIWGEPPPVGGGPFLPVIYLCGQNDTDFIRYRITNAATAFKVNDTSFNQLMPLNNSSSTWLVGTGSGFDTSKVRRIELLLFTQSTDFTVSFLNSTGLLP